VVEVARPYCGIAGREAIGAGRSMAMTISPAIVRRSRSVGVESLAAMTISEQ
jgi:hypothetical protein